MFTQSIKISDAFKLAIAFVLVLVLLEILFAIKTVLLIFFTSLILAMAMEQPIHALAKYKITRTASTVSIYVSALLAVTIMLVIFLPILATEFRNFIVSYPDYSEVLIGDEETVELQVMPYVRALSESVMGSSGVLTSSVFKMFGGITTYIAIFFIAFFINFQQGGVHAFISPFVPLEYKHSVMPFLNRVQDRVSSWLWGKFLSSLLVGLFTLFGLVTLGIPYAFMLAILSIFLNFIPFVGPIIAAVPAVILAISYSPMLGITVAFYYFFVNGILESFVFGPILMRRAVQVNPAFLILSLMSGAYLGGVLGIIVAIPTAAILYLVLTEYTTWRQTKNPLKEV